MAMMSLRAAVEVIPGSDNCTRGERAISASRFERRGILEGPGGTMRSSPPLQWRVGSAEDSRAIGTPESESAAPWECSAVPTERASRWRRNPALKRRATIGSSGTLWRTPAERHAMTDDTFTRRGTHSHGPSAVPRGSQTRGRTPACCRARCLLDTGQRVSLRHDRRASNLGTHFSTPDVGVGQEEILQFGGTVRGRVVRDSCLATLACSQSRPSAMWTPPLSAVSSPAESLPFCLTPASGTSWVYSSVMHLSRCS